MCNFADVFCFSYLIILTPASAFAKLKVKQSHRLRVSFTQQSFLSTCVEMNSYKALCLLISSSLLGSALGIANPTDGVGKIAIHLSPVT